ncbi:Terpenoid synthase [Ascosphaera apis ARSEF 7405]|uniref:Terpenoid synthase n=1 Tax=Ascosphaera apis ARSEF 7405 TaxID=392613 RepID=A0A168B0L7_9EURO|nr:Terpenoid synthase [Ascosphaera apis ARSEF 7405]
MAATRCFSRLECHLPRRPSRALQFSKRAFSSSSQAYASVAGAAQAEIDAARTYCSNLLQKYDRPSYTLKAFIPHASSDFYLAIRAFNVSLSMVPDVTSAPTVGLMRLQFWRDAINKTLAGVPPKEPVALLLASALGDLNERTQGRSSISKGWLLRLINSREQYLTNSSYTSLEALEQYAENTYSTLLYLTLSSLPLASVTADHLASHIGKAAGITTVLRGVPFVAFPQQPAQGRLGGDQSRQGAIMLPLDVMAQLGVREEDVFRRGADAEGLRDAVFTVATRASDHLITARQMLKNLKEGKDVGHEFEHEGEEGHEYSENQDQVTQTNPYARQLQEVHRGFGVLMPAVSTSLWLDALQKVDFDIFEPKLRTSPWTLPWKAFRAFQTKTL